MFCSFNFFFISLCQNNIIMEKLIELLKNETKSLKEQYIQKTIEWATRTYEISVEQSKWNEENWAKFLDIPTRIANPNSSLAFVTFYDGFWNSKTSKIYNKLRNQAYSIKQLGKDKYINKEINLAILHYDNSIVKLADRISRKNLNQDNLHLLTSHIGVNIETTITDGEKKVSAYTIIAEGEIQRPHYRYLVK